MSPFEHGEVFVLDDGGEVDLDLGNYERFLDIKLTRDNNITTGKIYQVNKLVSPLKSLIYMVFCFIFGTSNISNLKSHT
jgi:hypothetical protein